MRLGTSCSYSSNPNPTYAVSLAVSLFDRNPRTLVLYAWHDMYTRRHRIEWHSWCRVRPIEECACVLSSLQLEWSGRVRGVQLVGCFSGRDDKSFSLDCANARYLLVLTVYIFAIVHPWDFRNWFARHKAFDRRVESFANRLHLLRFVKWNFLCLPNRMKWNLFEIVILGWYVNICKSNERVDWILKCKWA